MTMIWTDWLKVIIILIFVTSLLAGFVIGYFFGDKECLENPFSYGIKILNEKYSDTFTCSCRSVIGKSNPFSFDEEKITDGFLGIK